MRSDERVRFRLTVYGARLRDYLGAGKPAAEAERLASRDALMLNDAALAKAFERVRFEDAAGKLALLVKAALNGTAARGTE